MTTTDDDKQAEARGAERLKIWAERGGRWDDSGSAGSLYLDAVACQVLRRDLGYVLIRLDELATAVAALEAVNAECAGNAGELRAKLTTLEASHRRVVSEAGERADELARVRRELMAALGRLEATGERIDDREAKLTAAGQVVDVQNATIERLEREVEQWRASTGAAQARAEVCASKARRLREILRTRDRWIADHVTGLADGHPADDGVEEA